MLADEGGFDPEERPGARGPGRRDLNVTPHVSRDRCTRKVSFLFLLYSVLLHKTEYIVIVQDKDGGGRGGGIKGGTWGGKVPSYFRKNCCALK